MAKNWTFENIPDLQGKTIIVTGGNSGLGYESVEAFAKKFSSEHKQLDVLRNNAGIMATPNIKTDDGFEAQLGTNHLGHFALTGHLLPLLKGTPQSRVVNVS